MSILSLCLGAALLGSGPAAAPPTTASWSATSAQDAATRVQALIANYQETQSAFYERLGAMEDQAAARRAFESENPLTAFVDKFRELAYESAGSEAGVTAWVWVANLSMEHNRGELAAEALEILVSDHVDSPQLAQVATNLLYRGSTLKPGVSRGALEKICKGSPHRSVQATASFALASLLMESDSDADKAKGRELFVEISTRYADVEGGWAQRAKGTLFELENLQIGMIAPDFTAVDQDGVAWNLYDYRGKVVVVDFWGFW